MEEDIAKSEIVFLSTVFDDEVLNIIEKYTGEDKTIIVLSSVGNGMRLTQIGKFCLNDIVDSFTDSKVAKVFSLLKKGQK